MLKDGFKGRLIIFPIRMLLEMREGTWKFCIASKKLEKMLFECAIGFFNKRIRPLRKRSDEGLQNDVHGVDLSEKVP